MTNQRVESLPRSTDPILAAGDRIVLSSFYEGIPSNFTRRVAALQNSFPITLEAQFEHSFFPIFPDLVQDTRWHTNPEGWIRRYQKQHFRCYVLKVDAVAKPDETEALRQELEDLMREGASGPANKDDETTDTQETQ